MIFSKLGNKISQMSKKQKVFAIVIASVFIINIVIASVAISIYMSKSSVQLEIYGTTEMTTLKALNKGGRKGYIKNPEGMFKNAAFGFTEDQKAIFEGMYNAKKNVALTVRIAQKNRPDPAVEDCPIILGFLYKDDFDKHGKYEEIPTYDTKRTVIKGSLCDAPEVFDISFALQKSDFSNNQLPEGFYIQTTAECEIIAACVVPAELGFDISREVPYYGFSCNGGVIDFTNKSFDFSGAPLIYPTKTSSIASLPEIRIKLTDEPMWQSTKEQSIYANLLFGGEKIRVKNVTPAEYVIIPTGGIKAPFSQMKIDSNAGCIKAVLMSPTNVAGKDVIKPIITDPGLILNYKTENWRTVDYELFEWDRYHKILFFDTRNYEVQDNFFRRMAFFVEKKGYQGKLLTDEELEGKHGYNAHDYSAISMANFFNKAHDLNFPLNKEEMLLRQILIENDLVEEDGEYLKPNEGGLVSISQESAAWLRDTFLAHEGWHTIFFRDEEFRNFVSAVYYTMDPASREFIIDYFASQPQLGYDPNDDYLMKNEFMAYIMQQRLSQVANYFVHLANRGSVMAYTPDLAAYIRETNAIHIEDAAIALNDFVFDKYGIVCGDICLVDRY